MDCSTPSFPVHHQLPELAQTHVHQVGDAIQPSHPLLSPSPPAFNLSQHQGFSNELVFCIRCPKYWSFSFSFSPSNTQDWFPLGLTGLIFTLSKVLLKAFSNTTVKSIMCHWKTTWLIISIYLFTPVLGIRQEHWWGNGPLSMCMCKYNLANQMGSGE